MKKTVIGLLLLLIVLSGKPVFSEEPADVDWSNLLDNTNLITSHPEEHATPYSDLPGNLSSIYDDVNKNHWAYQAIDELSTKYKVLEGMPDASFQGDRPATRYELAQALAKLMNKIEEDHIQVSPVEQAALNSLKSEFEKEIMTLAARIEVNAQAIANLEEKECQDVMSLNTQIENVQKRHYFSPELRFRFNMGDPEPFADTRLRLTSKTYLTDRTWVMLRLDALTPNMFKLSERNNDIADADLTLGFIDTQDLTKWIPEKYGRVSLIGGLLHTNRLFFRGYRVAADSRGFSDTIPGVSIYNTQDLSFVREPADGRNMSVGGEYVKRFEKYNGLIKAGVLRSAGGSINLPGADIRDSGNPSTFYSVTGQMDIPVKNQPVELKVSHYYSFNDRQTNQNTWSVGGRLATKFENVGVFKAAVIGYDGQVPPRYLGGYGGHGLSYQVTYNPTIKAFGNLFGDPDKITHSVYNFIPGKTEIGFAFANYHNDWNESLRVFDIFLSRYLSKNVWGVVRYSHLNPNTDRGLSTRDAVELMTVFKF
jgi:hypothetical protein